MTDVAELLSPVELAARMKLSTHQVIEFTREKDWPHVRFTNKSIRFTEEQVAQIIARHTYEPPVDEAAEVLASVSALALKQTKRSRTRTGS